MDQATIVEKIRERFGGRIVESGSFSGQHWVSVKPADLVELLTWLRDTPELDFNMLMDLGGVDYLGFQPEGMDDDEADAREHRYEVVYQMFSYKLRHRIRVKVQVRDEGVSVPSVWTIWRVANWMEREVYDMYGLRFEGHPNLIRILNHQDFEGHPLRKDYPINRRQKLSRPIDLLLTEKQEWA